MKKVEITPRARAAFQRRVWEFYGKHRRDFPWRFEKSAYAVFVSEVMLQQTQTARVLPKYEMFLREFPDFESLAKANPKRVLRAWSGLGYNRRALMLHGAAKIVARRYRGVLPADREALEELPGIGKGTSGALMAFIFNTPEPFIETNIRRVFLHHFFSSSRKKIKDDEIARLVSDTFDRRNPREWCYALMDYGSWLGLNKKTNPNRKSAGYKKQKAFRGSDREIRGFILAKFLAGEPIFPKGVAAKFNAEIIRVKSIVEKMKREKLIR